MARHAPNLGPGFWIRFTVGLRAFVGTHDEVHYNLFAGSVLAVGNERQVKQLEEIQSKATQKVERYRGLATAQCRAYRPQATPYIYRIL